MTLRALRSTGVQLRTVMTALGVLLAWTGSPAVAAGWPELSEAPAPQGGGETDAALIIAIEDYAFVARVPGARSNALAWYRYLTVTRGVRPENAKLLVNEDATDVNMLDEAAQKAQRVKPGGTFWLVFIGHGAPSADGHDGLLVGVDAQQSARGLLGRSVSQSKLLEAVSRAGAKRTVAVIDACFSGRTGTGASLAEGLQPLVALSGDLLGGARSVAVLSAGSGKQFAGPLPGAQVPAFSYLLLGALRGWGDRDRDGRVTASEAVGFAESALAATLSGRLQTPELYPPPTGEWVLSAPGRKAEAGPDLGELAMALSGGRKAAAAPVDVAAPTPQPRPIGEGSPSAVSLLAEPRVAEKAGPLRPVVEGPGRQPLERPGDDESGATVELKRRAGLDRDCAAGSAQACADLAGRLTQERSPRAAVLFERACLAGVGDACRAAGDVYRDGIGVPADGSVAERWYAEGCQRGSGGTCAVTGGEVEAAPGAPPSAATRFEVALYPVVPILGGVPSNLGTSVRGAYDFSPLFGAFVVGSFAWGRLPGDASAFSGAVEPGPTELLVVDNSLMAGVQLAPRWGPIGVGLRLGGGLASTSLEVKPRFVASNGDVSEERYLSTGLRPAAMGTVGVSLAVGRLLRFWLEVGGLVMSSQVDAVVGCSSDDLKAMNTEVNMGKDVATASVGAGCDVSEFSGNFPDGSRRSNLVPLAKNAAALPGGLAMRVSGMLGVALAF